MKKLNKKTWNFRLQPMDKEIIDKLTIDLGISRPLATIISNRGYKTSSEARDFIRKSQEILHDPFLMKDMDVAVDRIIMAVKENEKITIFGDYDVDGITSVSILLTYLKSIGACADYYIPCRKTEGYGVSKDAICKLKDNGTKLIITVDTGVTAIDEVDFANEIGVDFVITDHHECGFELPKAIAVVNPKRPDSSYPFQSLAGVGVVFKLLCALESKHGDTDIWDATRKIAYDYSDLTSIGTIADVMPVIDENRIIISLGLQQAEKTQNIGLRQLIEVCRSGEGKINKTKQKKKINSVFIGFTLAPRVNAAGRISSASIAANLFLEKDKNRAQELVYELCEINKERQATENKIADMAQEIVEKGNFEDKFVYVLDHNEWHNGVIGIVSSRVTERFGVPSILISFEGNENLDDPEALGKGSGRSLGGFNIVEALNECSDLLDKFGGHELAAGLTIKRKNLDEFRSRMEMLAKKSFNGVEPERKIEIDCELLPSEATMELAKELSCLEPYGVANPTPVFCMRNVIISDVVPIGLNRHLKLTLTKDNKIFTAMLFSVAPNEFDFDRGDEIDIAFNLDINEFNGMMNVQLIVRDVKSSERFMQFEKINEEMYQNAKDGNTDLSASYVIPEREDFALVYNHLLNSARLGKNRYRYSRLLVELQKQNNLNLNYTKLKLTIKVFRELNIITIDPVDDFTFEFRFSFPKVKTNLDKSTYLKKLKQLYSKK